MYTSSLIQRDVDHEETVKERNALQDQVKRLVEEKNALAGDRDALKSQLKTSEAELKAQVLRSTGVLFEGIVYTNFDTIGCSS